MKAGYVAETHEELVEFTQYQFIGETMSGRSWGRAGEGEPLTLTQKRKLEEAGYTKEDWGRLRPLASLATRWVLVTGAPRNRVFTLDELDEWKRLLNIAEIIAFA